MLSNMQIANAKVGNDQLPVPFLVFVESEVNVARLEIKMNAAFAILAYSAEAGDKTLEHLQSSRQWKGRVLLQEVPQGRRVNFRYYVFIYPQGEKMGPIRISDGNVELEFNFSIIDFLDC